MPDGFFCAIHNSMASILKVQGLSHSYGSRKALNDISFEVEKGQIFGFLGPNGGGKSTLFNILSTSLYPSEKGQIYLEGFDLLKFPDKVREFLGVVFQSPSLDKKLTVRENLKTQGHLYGLSGHILKERISFVLEKVGLLDRQNDFVEILSGGLRRRAEIAKGLLHSPTLLILDEPTTGLDPGARINIWRYLTNLKKEGITCLVTTHLMEEGDLCDQLGILDEGNLIAKDSPAHLKKEIGGDIVSFKSQNSEELKNNLENKFSCKTFIIDNTVRVETQNSSQLIADVMKVLGGNIDSVTLSKPTLEDVFIKKTEHKFWENL